MVSGGLVMLGALLALGARLSAAPAPIDLSQGESAASEYLNDMLLESHGALKPDHQMARKSVRSPSRRLRFGRRSDPLMPPRPEFRDLEELQQEREIRAPVRMRFGKRLMEQEIRDLEDMERDIRAPVRMRFGKRLMEQLADREFRGNQDLETEAEE